MPTHRIIQWCYLALSVFVFFIGLIQDSFASALMILFLMLLGYFLLVRVLSYMEDRTLLSLLEQIINGDMREAQEQILTQLPKEAKHATKQLLLFVVWDHVAWYQSGDFKTYEHMKQVIEAYQPELCTGYPFLRLGVFEFSLRREHAYYEALLFLAMCGALQFHRMDDLRMWMDVYQKFHVAHVVVDEQYAWHHTFVKMITRMLEIHEGKMNSLLDDPSIILDKNLPAMMSESILYHLADCLKTKAISQAIDTYRWISNHSQFPYMIAKAKHEIHALES